MDPVLQAAEAKRDELRQELRKIEDFMATYRSLALSVRLDSKNETETNDSSTENVSQPADEVREAENADAAPAKRVRVRDNPKPTDVVAAAVELIRQNERPMTRREIHTALKERGMEVKGADPIKAIGTTLWRTGRNQLEQIEGRGYWLRGEALSPERDPSYPVERSGAV